MDWYHLIQLTIPIHKECSNTNPSQPTSTSSEGGFLNRRQERPKMPPAHIININAINAARYHNVKRDKMDENPLNMNEWNDHFHRPFSSSSFSNSY